MEIVIIRNKQETILKHYKDVWKLSTRKYIIPGIFVVIIGIALLILNEHSEMSDINRVYSSIGLVVLFYTITILGQIFKAKNKYDLALFRLLGILRKDQHGVELTFSDIGIIYNDFEIKMEMKWSIFSHYKFYKNYLCLFDVFGKQAIFINKDEITPDQLSELVDFIRLRLKTK